MARGRPAGAKNRNFPPRSLAEAVRVAQALQDEAGGTKVSRLTMAELLDTTPTSRVFKELVASSRFYGLTNGGINAEEFGLTSLGEKATSGDEVERIAASKTAVLSVAPFKSVFETFSGKKWPAATVLREHLVKQAGIDAAFAEECMTRLTEDAAAAGLTRTVKGSLWIDLAGIPVPPAVDASDVDDAEEIEGSEPEDDEPQTPAISPPPGAEAAGSPKKVFIAHGKNRTPLEQLKTALDAFKVKYAVAVDEPNSGRPVSKKVADLMRDQCSSGVFIFTADERFLRENEDGTTQEVWRPSENVVYELGAAAILYDTRIVIFKEKGVTFPSDYRDLGYIEFEKDQLVAEIGNLFKELVALDILEVRAKG